MVKYLLDTSVIIEALRTKKFNSLQFLNTVYRGKLYISGISIAELFSRASAQEKEVDAFLRLVIDSMNIVDADKELMITAGKLRFFNKVAIADAVIAASAVENGLVIVTHNKKDFQNIKGLKIIAPII